MRSLAWMYVGSTLAGAALWALGWFVVAEMATCHAQTVETRPIWERVPAQARGQTVDVHATPTATQGIKFASPSVPLPKVDAVVTFKEWQKIRSSDSVQKFVERVNNAAVADPEWHTDFQRAHYRAFVEQANKYLLETYFPGKKNVVIQGQ